MEILPREDDTLCCVKTVFLCVSLKVEIKKFSCLEV